MWDCRWLSTHPQEDERLLIGGLYTIRIESITIKRTGKSYGSFFKPLFYYDAMLTGISMLKHKPNIEDKHKQILKHLIRCHLKQEKCEDKDHEYIHDTFRVYSNHRKQIVLNLYQVYMFFG
eukprot:23160_1